MREKEIIKITKKGSPRFLGFLSLLLVFLLAVSLLFPIAGSAAKHEDVESISRGAPESFEALETVEIVLNIQGEAPLAVGIVETIPEGFSFPEKDEEVSEAKHFKLDREQGKIAFSLLEDTKIRYKVIAPPEGGKNKFRGEWVDLLVQTPELNEGKERWKPVHDPNSTLPAPTAEKPTRASSSSKASKNSDSNKTGAEASSNSTPAPGVWLTFLCLLSCATVFLKTKGGEKE
ncbi:MAG: hypothetical protein PHD41_02220 [Methanosarcinaceae archaeon]|nr:hypothetical protein [Methanosarcinaceae archaeon]MDD4331670.1 hypothetical protein [Methanosarcinaceae archaeon]